MLGTEKVPGQACFLDFAGMSPSWLAGVPIGWRHVDCSLCRLVGFCSPGLRAPGSHDQSTCLVCIAHRLQSVALPLGTATQKMQAQVPILHTDA